MDAPATCGSSSSGPTEWQALWGSLWISVASVVLAAAIGIPLAFLFARYELPGGRCSAGLVALPAVLPPLVGVLAFLFLYGETGFVSLLVQRIFGLTDPPWRLQGAGAILLVHAYSMYVYFYLFVRAALQSLDGSLYEAAASLGAGRWRTLRRVVLPQLDPALGGAALLTFMTALASFSAPYIFGGGFRVMPTQIVATRLNGDDRLAMVETISLTVLALAALWLFRGAGPVDGAAGGRKGAAPARLRVRSRPLRLRARRGWAGGWRRVLLLPHLTLLLVSFVPVGTWTIEPVPPAYTLRNYLTLVQDPVRARPLANSLWLATVATIAAVAIALAGALVAGRRRVRGRSLIEALLALPWAVPGTVFAIALATAFSVRAPWTGRIILVGTLWILPLAYLVRNLPITSRAILAGVRALDPSLDEAAATLGRRPRAHPAPHYPAAAPAGAPGGGEPRVRHRVRRFRDLDHALHLRHPADLARDPLQPAPVGRRRGGGVRRRAHAGERRRLRRRGRPRRRRMTRAGRTATAPGSAGSRC